MNSQAVNGVYLIELYLNLLFSDMTLPTAFIINPIAKDNADNISRHIVSMAVGNLSTFNVSKYSIVILIPKDIPIIKNIMLIILKNNKGFSVIIK